jgi:hypothetical protein
VAVEKIIRRCDGLSIRAPDRVMKAKSGIQQDSRAVVYPNRGSGGAGSGVLAFRPLSASEISERASEPDWIIHPNKRRHHCLPLARRRSWCSKADAIRSISALLRPCRADSSRHFDTACRPDPLFHALVQRPVRNTQQRPRLVLERRCCRA